MFNALYRRVLCRQRVNDDQLTVVSLQALAKVYRRYHKEIGRFSDMSYILQLTDRVCIYYYYILSSFEEIKNFVCIDTFVVPLAITA